MTDEVIKQEVRNTAEDILLEGVKLIREKANERQRLVHQGGSATTNAYLIGQREGLLSAARTLENGIKVIRNRRNSNA